MALSSDITQLFQWLDKPAFLVENGHITLSNQAAQHRGFLPEASVSELLQSGREAYAELTGGSLYLTVHSGDLVCDACVHCMDNVQVFILEQNDPDPPLQALAQVSSHFRYPLGDVISAAERLCDLLPPDSQELSALAGQLNRSLNQLHRLVSNMSDAYLYRNGNFLQLQLRDLTAFAEEIFRKGANLCESVGLRLEFTVPQDAVFCLFDSEMLERAIWNLLSNAMKFSVPGSTVRAALKRTENRVQLSICDSGRGIAPQIRSSIYTRYARTPELEDRLQGPGLGMSLVFSAAKNHGGTVLLEQPDGIGTRVTLSFPIRQTTGMLRSPTVPIDYAGERDHGLLELSDVLPSHLYKN